MSAEQQAGLDAIQSEATKGGLTWLERVYALATSWVESSLRPSAVGDNGTSFGLFEHHVGGAGGATLTSARRYLDPKVSAAERVPWFGSRDIDTGAEAAALQRPADPAGYAVKVDAAAASIRSGRLPDGTALNATTGGTAAAPAASGGGDVVAIAKTQLGVPYVWGGTTPGKGFDCSGLVQWAYGRVGITLPRTSFQQRAATTKIDQAEAKPGDLVFYTAASHVAIYVGNGQMLNAPNSRSVIRLEPLWPNPTFCRVPGYAATTDAVDLTPWDGALPGPDIDMDAIGQALKDATEWLGEHFFATVIIALGLLLGASLIAIGGLQAFSGSSQGAVNIATTVIPQARAAKGAKGAKGATAAKGAA